MRAKQSTSSNKILLLYSYKQNLHVKTSVAVWVAIEWFVFHESQALCILKCRTWRESKGRKGRRVWRSAACFLTWVAGSSITTETQKGGEVIASCGEWRERELQQSRRVVPSNTLLPGEAVCVVLGRERWGEPEYSISGLWTNKFPFMLWDMV